MENNEIFKTMKGFNQWIVTDKHYHYGISITQRSLTLHILQSSSKILHPIAVDKHAIPMSNVKTHTKQMTTTSEWFIMLSIQAMPIRFENMDNNESTM
jgi:hypothetical protein